MPWRKLGQIFTPENRAAWFVSHAALPVAERIDTDLYRVYFSGRDSKSRAQIGWYTFDIRKPHEVLEVSTEPVIRLGPPGSFDENGVTSSCLVAHQGRRYQYYSGWTLGVTVPFYFYVGLAVAEVGSDQYEKVSAAPILERNKVDPYLTASPSVLVEGDLWRMWYISCDRWSQEADGIRHYYHIRYAESDDGIEWRREGRVSVDFESPDEYAFARPHVIKEGDLYRMWYCYRGQAYRIGYAESADGLAWTRRDHLAGVMVSDTGWDSGMVAYPAVFDHDGARYMLYNGNAYGRTGIGCAVYEE